MRPIATDFSIPVDSDNISAIQQSLPRLNASCRILPDPSAALYKTPSTTTMLAEPARGCSEDLADAQTEAGSTVSPSPSGWASVRLSINRRGILHHLYHHYHAFVYTTPSIPELLRTVLISRYHHHDYHHYPAALYVFSTVVDHIGGEWPRL